MSESNDKQPRGRIGRILVWTFVKPVTDPFLRPIRIAREARRILRDTPTITLAGQQSNGQPPERPDRLMLTEDQRRLRRQSRLWAVFFTLITLAVLGWWGLHILSGHWALVSLASLETLWLTLMMGLQALVQSFANWKARGHQGGFATFLADGRQIWPR